MSTIGTTSPVVPLSTLLDPSGAADVGPADGGQPAAGAGTAAQQSTPPPVVTRGVSALSFGLSPPPAGGSTEAELQEIRQQLNETRSEVRAREDQAAAEKARTADIQVGGVLAEVVNAFNQLANLRLESLPAVLAEQAEKLAEKVGLEDELGALNKQITELESQIAGILLDAVGELGKLAREAFDLLFGGVDAVLSAGASAIRAAAEFLKVDGAVGPLLDAIDAARDLVDAVEEKIDNVVEAINNLVQEEANLRELINQLIALVTGLLFSRLPIFSALAGLVDEERDPRLESAEALEGKTNEEKTEEVQVIVSSAAADRADEAELSDALFLEANNLDDVRTRQVGLAFAQIYTSLQQALTMMEDALEKMPQGADALASEGEARVRLELAGRA